MAVTVDALSFLIAVYLVNMTFINQALAQRGEGWRVGFPPPSLGVCYSVIATNFGIMKLVFLGIIMYECWFIPPDRAPRPVGPVARVRVHCPLGRK